MENNRIHTFPMWNEKKKNASFTIWTRVDGFTSKKDKSHTSRAFINKM